jgi:hypothetical protein
MTKPSDFFIGVVDFFAVLLPGAALVYLLGPLMISGTPKGWLPATPTQGWVMFLVLAYIAGHLLHALGSWLLDDFVYGEIYLRRYREPHWQASKLKEELFGLEEYEKAAQTLLARVRLTKVNQTGTNYYDWCLSDVRVSSPAGAIEVDRIQADSKFFRSMVFVFLVAALISFRQAQAPLWVSVGAVALTVFALCRFCQLRWTATKRVCEFYLLLGRRFEDGGSAATLPNKALDASGGSMDHKDE